jgi:hypothetical protein
MDPYLEAYWGDVHATLIIYAREQLQRQLPKELRVRVEERVFVESDDRELDRRTIYPDARIYERPHRRERPESATGGGVARAKPPLDTDGEAWAHQLLLEKGLRK